MIQHNMTLARHNELKAHYRGKATGIQQELKDAGFDIKRDYSVGQERGTGNLIFMQAEPKKVEPEEVPVTYKAKPTPEKKAKPTSKADLAKKKLALIQKKVTFKKGKK